jgi:hypothetical protein
MKESRRAQITQKVRQHIHTSTLSQAHNHTNNHVSHLQSLLFSCHITIYCRLNLSCYKDTSLQATLDYVARNLSRAVLRRLHVLQQRDAQHTAWLCWCSDAIAAHFHPRLSRMNLLWRLCETKRFKDKNESFQGLDRVPPNLSCVVSYACTITDNGDAILQPVVIETLKLLQLPTSCNA